MASQPRVVRLNRNTVMTVDLALALINQWGINTARYSKLQDYYEGEHSILYRTFEDKSKPNNKLINNFASYIVDVRTGYFTGVPLTYTSENRAYLETMKTILEYNDEQDVTSELDKISNTKGHSYELHWIDETGIPRFKQMNPDELIAVYSADISEEMLYGIRYWEEKHPTDKTVDLYIDIYDNENISHFKVEKYGKKDSITFNTGFEPHYYGEVPIVEYLNNGERMGSFEDEIPLIDAYNLAESDSINDIQYFNDAYLKGKNLSATEPEDIAKMKENRFLLVDGDGDIEWLTKNINDTYLENIKDRVSKDIHKFSKTPNLVSEEFISNLSGTAIRYKVWGLEQDTSQKERKWNKSVAKRLRLITNIINLKGNSVNPHDIKVVFNRNLPQNVMELGQMVSQLRGTVSLETLLSQLPFVNDVKEEIDRLESEQAVFETFGLTTETNTTDTQTKE